MESPPPAPGSVTSNPNLFVYVCVSDPLTKQGLVTFVYFYYGSEVLSQPSS